MSYEIVTHDGKIYEINQDDPKIIAKLANRLELVPVSLTNGKIEYFAKGNVARIQHTNKTIDNTRRLPSGDTDKRADCTGPGYKKYLEAREKLIKGKNQTKPSKLDEAITS